MSFLSKVKDTIQRNELLANGDSVLVALSGGPDSVALLSVLASLRSKENLEVHAVYINHQIRPNAAGKEEKFCRELCRKLKIQFVSVSENIPKLSKKLKKGIEETGRDFRYEKLNEIADEHGCKKIALGHHRDDRIETTLFRVIRGTGRTGLKGIPVKRDKFIRPLFDVSKVEILKYLRTKKIKYCIDQSNKSVEYKRNFIRNKLLPLLRKNLNSNVDSALLNLTDSIVPEEEFLEAIIESDYKESVSYTPAGKLFIALNKFNGYDLWRQKRLLRRCLTEVSGSYSFPDKITIDRVLAATKGKKMSVTVPPKIQCQVEDDKLFVYRKKKLTFSAKINVPGETIVKSAGIQFKTKIFDSNSIDVKRKRRSLNVIVDLKKISGKLAVRNIKNGDKFKPLGMNGSKKVGDYLTDRKSAQILRDEIPVVTDDIGIVWLAGYEIDDRVKVNGNTKEALEIELSTNS